MTLTPTYPFQLPSANPVSSVYLAFVVSDTEEPCTPSWGTFYTLDSAEAGLDLDARTAQLRSQGGSVMISYGGQANTELAVDCTDPAKLQQAYLEPIQRYKAKAIDLDIEGASLADTAANARRATAIAAVQKELAAEKKPLQVWMTLPVSSHGLTAEGIAAVQAMLKARRQPRRRQRDDDGLRPGRRRRKGHAGDDRARARRDPGPGPVALARPPACRAAPAAAWGHVGVTPMLGVNDVTDQRFTTKDAEELAKFVDARGIPRVSAWSLNRDSQCGGAFAKTGELSNTCSGVVQKPLEFTHIFSELRGTKTADKEATAAGRRDRRPKPQTVTDDPATSPYPIWRPAAAYGSRLQGRLAGPDLPVRLVEPGHPARHRRRRRAERPVAADRPGPRRQPRRRSWSSSTRRLRQPGRRPPSTTTATRSPSTACPTRPAGTRRANSRWPNCPPTRAPPGNRCSSTRASRTQEPKPNEPLPP